MRQKTGPQTSAAEKTIKDIRRATRKHHSASSQGEFLDIHPGCGLIADIRHCAEASAGCLFHPASAIHLSAERLGMNRYSPPFMTLKV